MLCRLVGLAWTPLIASELGHLLRALVVPVSFPWDGLSVPLEGSTVYTFTNGSPRLPALLSRRLNEPLLAEGWVWVERGFGPSPGEGLFRGTLSHGQWREEAQGWSWPRWPGSLAGPGQLLTGPHFPHPSGLVVSHRDPGRPSWDVMAFVRLPQGLCCLSLAPPPSHRLQDSRWGGGSCCGGMCPPHPHLGSPVRKDLAC